MRPSFERVRSWFSSTDFESVSTLSFTWVTSPRTNFFVAHAVVPPSAKVVAQLWEKWRIIATPIVHEEYTGLRITPNVYTTLEEIDTFTKAMETVVG